ncbi:hypothetical protein RJ640_007490 [Escallonia rubra]|uniref:Retrotransposon gag domain-containing protein n=1 Tax=Escallonia rubra TaxID=112253 RepID=A0AA88RST8_9ASTE|nr:hypothetical protein RJ640_007490 [Escallonia rubra]
MTSSVTVKYPYPATLNVGNFVSLRLTPSNYLLGKTQISALIESQDMQRFLDGEYRMPKVTILASEGTTVEGQNEVLNLDFIAWKRSDRLLRGWITGTLSEEVLGLVVGLITAGKVWKVLEEAFAQDSQEREFQLVQNMTMLRKGTDSINEYIGKFKFICDNLAIGKTVPDNNKVFWLLQGLGHRYEKFVTIMLKPLVPSYNDIVPLLQSYEAHNLTHRAESFGGPQLAYYGQNINGDANNRNANTISKFSSRGKELVQGNNANMSGGSGRAHFNAGNMKVGQNEGAAKTNQPHTQRKDIKNKAHITCQICGRKNLTTLKCFNHFNNSYQTEDVPEALSAFQIGDNKDLEWYPDTGATNYMTGKCRDLQLIME